MKRVTLAFYLAVVVSMLMLGVPRASADVVFVSTLDAANCSSATSCLSGSTTGPYGTVTVNWLSTTSATITFAAAAGYRFGGAQAADVNIAGGFAGVSNLVGNGSGALTSTGPGTADGFGNFTNRIDAFNGLNSASTLLSFTVTAPGSTTWADAASVLTNNGSGYDAAAHVFVASGPNTGLTGFAAETVPDGGVTLMLLGGALAGVETLRRRLRA